MFCPGCGSENDLRQGYCRQCGQALSSVRLALEGNAEQSLEKLKASEKWIQGGSTTLIVFTVIAVIISILSVILNAPAMAFSAIINLVLGLAIGLPLILAGKANLKRAVRLLSESQPEPVPSVLDERQQANGLLTNGVTNELRGSLDARSVTEHATLNLREPDRVHHGPS
jgi:hypothetical protein